MVGWGGFFSPLLFEWWGGVIFITTDHPTILLWWGGNGGVILHPCLRQIPRVTFKISAPFFLQASLQMTNRQQRHLSVSTFLDISTCPFQAIYVTGNHCRHQFFESAAPLQRAGNHFRHSFFENADFSRFNIQAQFLRNEEFLAFHRIFPDSILFPDFFLFAEKPAINRRYYFQERNQHL
jgi:hypothetical protein